MGFKVNSKGDVVVTLSACKEVLTIRTPKGRDVRLLEKLSNVPDTTNIDIVIGLLCALTGKEEDYFLDLDATDLQEAIEAVYSFRLFSKPA